MMMLTEDEAKTKWCPMFRSAIAKAMSEYPEYTTNRDDIPGTGGSKCLASGCMAWRKSDDPEAEFDKHGNLPGYCGAFGKVSP